MSDNEHSPAAAAAAEAPAAANGAPKQKKIPFQRAAAKLAEFLLGTVVVELVANGAIKQAVQQKGGLAKAIKAAGVKLPGAAKAPKKKRGSRGVSAYNMFFALANHHLPGVANISVAAACWKGLGEQQPELKQQVVQRLEAIKGTVNGNAEQAKDEGGAAGAGEPKVHVAEVLASYEAEQGLQPFDWQEMVTPYAGTPHHPGRRKEPAPAAGAGGGDDSAAQQQQQTASGKKRPAAAGGAAAAAPAAPAAAGGASPAVQKHKKHKQHIAPQQQQQEEAAPEPAAKKHKKKHKQQQQ